MSVYVFDRMNFMGTHTVDGDELYIDSDTGLVVVQNQGEIAAITYLAQGQIVILEQEDEDEDDDSGWNEPEEDEEEPEDGDEEPDEEDE